MPTPSARRRPAVRSLVLSGVVLALVAVVFLLQGRDGSDLPDRQGDAEEGAILGSAIQLVVPHSPNRPASPSGGASASAGASEGPEETPTDGGTGGDGVEADQPDDSASGDDRPSKDGGDPTDVIEDVVDKLLGGSSDR